MAKLIKKEEGVVREIAESYSVTNFVTSKISENVSLAVGNAQDHSETTTSKGSDRIYYVTEGKLVVNDNLVAEVGDVVFVPKGEEYSFSGTFKAVIVNSPAFKPKNEEIKLLK